MLISPYLLTPVAAGGTFPSGLSVWARYKASSMTGIADNGAVAQWDDISGNNRHATQATAAQKPIKRNTATGLSHFNTVAMDFQGTDADPHALGLPSMAGLSQGQIFVFLKGDVDVSNATRRLWQLGAATDGYYTFAGFSIDGIYETFGTNSRKATGNPGGGIINAWHSYIVSAQSSGAYDTWLNNSLFYSVTGNGVGFSAAPTIGGNLAGSSGTRLANKLIAEIVILDIPASSTDRTALQTYFLDEYTR